MITLDGNNGITSPDFEPSSSTTPTNGLFLPTTNTLGFATNSTERLRLDASGNLGLGVTPSAWSLSGLSAVQVKNGSFAGYNNVFYVSSNAYYNSGWKYIASDFATQYDTYNGQHRFFTAPSGTAGNAITFTQAMTLDASGNLGIGTTSPGGRLDVSGGYSYFYGLRISGNDTGNTIYQNAAIGISSGNYITFSTNASGPYERARIDSSGNLLVGTTSASETANVGVKLLPTGNAYIVNAASTGASEGFSMYSTGAGAWRFYCTWAGQIYATSTTITGISDQRLKENVRDLDDGLATILALKPRKFDWKEGKGKDIKDDRGFIAQEFEQVFPDLVDTWKDEPSEGEEPYKAVRPDLIPVLVKAIQELTARLEALEAK